MKPSLTADYADFAEKSQKKFAGALWSTAGFFCAIGVLYGLKPSLTADYADFAEKGQKSSWNLYRAGNSSFSAQSA